MENDAQPMQPALCPREGRALPVLATELVQVTANQFWCCRVALHLLTPAASPCLRLFSNQNPTWRHLDQSMFNKHVQLAQSRKSIFLFMHARQAADPLAATRAWPKKQKEQRREVTPSPLKSWRLGYRSRFCSGAPFSS